MHIFVVRDAELQLFWKCSLLHVANVTRISIKWFQNFQRFELWRVIFPTGVDNWILQQSRLLYSSCVSRAFFQRISFLSFVVVTCCFSWKQITCTIDRFLGGLRFRGIWSSVFVF